MAQRVSDWHQDGTMSKQVWGAAGGATYRGANEEFVNGQVVVYISGSWQVPQFVKTIGDAFDWQAVPQPCGPAACTGMPGGAALVAFKPRNTPAEVARLMDYLASEAVTTEATRARCSCPPAPGLPAGSEYRSRRTRGEEVARGAFGRRRCRRCRRSPTLQGYALNRAMFNATVQPHHPGHRPAS